MRTGRIAAAFISWRACEASGWGLLLPAIRGVDPAQSGEGHAGRIAVAPPEDVNLARAAKIAPGGMGLSKAARDGIFVPSGTGDANIAQAVIALEHPGDPGRCALEQDTATIGAASDPCVGPIEDVRTCMDYLAREVVSRLATVAA